MKTKIIAVLILLGIVSFAIYAGVSNKSKETSQSQETSEKRVVRIGFPQGTGDFAGDLFGIDQRKGFLKEELQKIGVTVEYLPFAGSGPAVNEAFASKNIDLAVYGDFPALVLKSKGINTKLIAVTQSSLNSALVVKKDSTISSIKDLKGKKVAFPKGTLLQRFLDEALAANGLSEKDLDLTNMNLVDMGSALLTGKVDAIVTTSSSASKLAITNKEAKIVMDSKDYPDWSGVFGVVGSDEYLKENPDIAVALIKSLISSRDFVKENKEEAFKIWANEGSDLESAKYVYGYDESFSIFPVEISDSNIKKLNNVVKYLIKNNLIKNEVDINQFIDKSYYEKAVKNN